MNLDAFQSGKRAIESHSEASRVHGLRSEERQQIKSCSPECGEKCVVLCRLDLGPQ